MGKGNLGGVKHWVLALYIASYSTGFANMTLCFLAWMKTRDPALKHFLVILAVFVGQLLLSNLTYFANAYLGAVHFEAGWVHLVVQALLMVPFTLAGAWFTHSLVTDPFTPRRRRLFVVLSLVPLALLAFEVLRSLAGGGAPGEHRDAEAVLLVWRQGFVVYATVFFWTRLARARNPFFRSLMVLIIVLDLVMTPLVLAEIFWNARPDLAFRPLSLENLYYFVGSLGSALGVAWVYFLHTPPVAPVLPASDLLTDREREVVGLVAQGLSNKEIAGRLFLSPVTVKNHLYKIFQKTGARSRVDLLRRVGSPPG